MRVIRIIRFFSELRVMVLAICSSLRLLLWASCLLVMLMYLFAVSFVQIVETQLANGTIGSDGELVVYWGSLPRAIYTLYLSITNGISWDDAAKTLLMISPSLVVAYCAYIAIALFCVLNTITGIIVDKATNVISADDDCRMWNELDKKKRWVRDVKLLFRKADKDNTGKLEWEGFHKLLTDLQMQNILKCLGVDVMAIEPRMLFDLFDTDGGGSIDINEFASSIQKLHGSAKAVDLARLKFKLVGMNKKVRDIMDILEPPQGLARGQARRGTVMSFISGKPDSAFDDIL
jgi:Ca2+-binding EF-hand superfamily protein